MSAMNIDWSLAAAIFAVVYFPLMALHAGLMKRVTGEAGGFWHNLFWPATVLALPLLLLFYLSAKIYELASGDKTQ